jgi:NADPH:quinone reductase-like Zn-dependent oxidoreductase
LDSADVVFRDVTLRGFWYSAWLSSAPETEVLNLFSRLVDLHSAGKLKVPLEAVYPVDNLAAALAHAERPARSGKVVMRW